MMKIMGKQSVKTSTAFIFSLLLLLVGLHTSALAQAPTDEQPNYTRPTVLTRPVAPSSSTPASTTAQPATPEVAPPAPGIRIQGLRVESLDGKVLMEQDADQAYNPASAVKLGTALTALKTFGADYRFSTALWTN